jgi:23S rRNA (cytosine1962-C5)-methyltransferase
VVVFATRSRRAKPRTEGMVWGAPMAQVVLKGGHVQPVWAGHPWVFPQGIAEIRGKVLHGDEVLVVDAEGHELGFGFYAERSAIAVRIFSSAEEGAFGQALVERRLRAALARRLALGLPDVGQRPTDGYRLAHGEGDGLPGLIVDRYGPHLVLQLGTAGMARRLDVIVRGLCEVMAPEAILDRTSARVAESEGFAPPGGAVFGAAPEVLRFRERGLSLTIPLALGQKTGFYFDQRPLRERIESLSAGRRVLDAYSYVGAVGLSAARGGAREVTSVDSSAPALEVLAALARENGLSVSARKADAVEFMAAHQQAFDLVVADPPKLSPGRAARDRALRAFRRIAATALGSAAEGGLVVLSSCSQAIGLLEVERAVALGAKDARRRAVVAERLFQGADHPVPPAFPQGLYLSTVICHVE